MDYIFCETDHLYIISQEGISALKHPPLPLPSTAPPISSFPPSPPQPNSKPLTIPPQNSQIKKNTPHRRPSSPPRREFGHRSSSAQSPTRAPEHRFTGRGRERAGGVEGREGEGGGKGCDEKGEEEGD